MTPLKSLINCSLNAKQNRSEKSERFNYFLTNFDAHGKIIQVSCETVGGCSSTEEVMAMTVTLLELVAILSLLVAVISLCYDIFGKDK